MKKDFNPYKYFLEIGFQISLPLVFFVVLGVWLDKKLDTGHTLLFSGIGLSLFASFYAIKKSIDKLKEE